MNDEYKSELPGVALGSQHPIAAFIPMDGYHLTRAQLSAMPDPENAHARRGAAFTFDGDAFLRLIEKLREPLAPEAKTVYAPSFDHATKDPVQDDIAISPATRILVFEGNYVALDEKPWRDAADLMDEIWFIEVDNNVARERLIKRHIEAGIANDRETAAKRADENDLVNGREILDKKRDVHETLQSIRDDTWEPEAQGAV